MATLHLPFFEIYKEVLNMQGAWLSLNTLPTTLHGQAFCIITWQRSEELCGFWAMWIFISTQSKKEFLIMLDESVHKQNYTCHLIVIIVFIRVFNFIIVVIVMSWLWCRDTNWIQANDLLSLWRFYQVFEEATHGMLYWLFEIITHSHIFVFLF